MGLLKLADTNNVNDFLKRKRGLILVKDTDNLCLPRAIVAVQARIQHYLEKSLPRNAYACIVGTKRSVADRQGCLAKNLCQDCHVDTRLYQSGQKKFGMDEIKIFADFLAPKYGLAVFSGLTANTKVFQTEGTCDYWINLLNLGQHYDAISGPQGFFNRRHWCTHCNKGYSHTKKRRCRTGCKNVTTKIASNHIGEEEVEEEEKQREEKELVAVAARAKRAMAQPFG